MKNILFPLFFILFAITSYCQVNHTVIFKSDYSSLGIIPRIENDGIFGISSFDVDNERIALVLKDRRSVLLIDSDRNKSLEQLGEKNDYLLGVEGAGMIPRDELNPGIYKTIFVGGVKKPVGDRGGIIGDGDSGLKLRYINRSTLSIIYELPGLKRKSTIYFNNDLACADFIGIDSGLNTFLLIEKYKQEIPLEIERYIYTLSPAGTLLSVLKVPLIKYLSLETEFRIDAGGNLYQLLTEKETISILKWSGLNQFTNGIINYPSEYNYSIHFNKFVTKNEAVVTNPVKSIEAASSRVTAIRLGETYAYHRYNVSAANIASVNTTAPDGDIVKTPPWLIVGRNARVPYKWGGFNTLAQIDAGLVASKYSGDIHTSGVSSYAVGVDCSGFVSRCWQMTYHASTSYMPGITTQYSSWDSLKPADAIHKVGHVRLFLERNSNGSFKVVESAGRNWDVSYWSFLASDLTDYTPRYYNSMQNDFAAGRPQMSSAMIMPANQIKLNWTADTSGIAGYRLYRSFDGLNYNMVMNENNLKSDNTTVPQEASQAYYRVARVLNNPPLFTESNWSNSVSAFNSGSPQKYLIVDGFSREIGSWQGPGHNFVANYAKALKTLNLSYDAVKSAYLSEPSVNLNDYFAVIWIAGDESLLDETFSDSEQSLIKNYLESGGNLFVSGSEIGWDLFARGSASDKLFYNNYLKAAYISDDAGVTAVSGVSGSAMHGLSFAISQSYEEDFPDEIGIYGGSALCMSYSNNKGAGIQYTGAFGTSTQTGKVIYLSFPLETTADDTAFNKVIRAADVYFNAPFSAVSNEQVNADQMELFQSFPNPAYGRTIIKYRIAGRGGNAGVNVKLKIFDVLGREVSLLVDENKAPGAYSIEINTASLTNGIYYYRLTAGSEAITRKFTVIK